MANFDTRKAYSKCGYFIRVSPGRCTGNRHLCLDHFYSWENLEAAVEIRFRSAIRGELPETVRLAKQMLEKLKTAQREASK